MQQRRLTLAALGVLLSILPAREALGAGPERPLGDVIEVQPGATCIEAGALAEQVGTWLGSQTADADVWVRVEGSADDPRTVSFDMGRGDRLLARRRFAPGPERCEHLEAALGLAIALALRVSLIDEIVGPRQPEVPAAEPQYPWALSAGAVVGFGVLPGTPLGATLRAERELPPNLALRLGVLGLAVRDRTFSTVPGSFDAEILALRLDGCLRLDFSSRLGARVCVGLMGGALLAQGSGFDRSRTAASPWFAETDALGLSVGLTSRWALEGEVALVLPLRRYEVGVLTPMNDVVDQRALSTTGVTMQLGPVYRF